MVIKYSTYNSDFAKFDTTARVVARIDISELIHVFTSISSFLQLFTCDQFLSNATTYLRLHEEQKVKRKTYFNKLPPSGESVDLNEIVGILESKLAEKEKEIEIPSDEIELKLN